MTTIKHSEMKAIDGIHQIHSFELTATQLSSFVPPAGSLHKLILNTSDNTFYKIDTISPFTYSSIKGDGGGGGGEVELHNNPIIGLLYNLDDDLYRRWSYGLNEFPIEGNNEFSSWKTNSSDRQNTNDVGVPSPLTKYLNQTPNLPYSHMKRVIINNAGNEVKDFNANSYTHTDLVNLLPTEQVMTRMPKQHFIQVDVVAGGKNYECYFTSINEFVVDLDTLGLGNITSVTASQGNGLPSGTVSGNTVTSIIHPAFDTKQGIVDNRYYGSFEAVQGISKCGSGVKPTGTSRIDARPLVEGFGTGFHQLDIHLRGLLVHLAYIEAGTKYLERNGISTDNKWEGCSALGGSTPNDTGLTLSLGNKTGVVLNGSNKAIANNYRGIENWHSHLYNWVDGVNINDRQVYIAKPKSNYDDDSLTTGDYLDTGLVTPSSGYMSSLHIGSIVPKELGGSATTLTTDHVYSNTGLRALRVGGYLSLAGSSGATYWTGNHAASDSAWRFCARSSF